VHCHYGENGLTCHSVQDLLTRRKKISRTRGVDAPEFVPPVLAGSAYKWDYEGGSRAKGLDPCL
jgi:hypothetical protein